MSRPPPHPEEPRVSPLRGMYSVERPGAETEPAETWKPTDERLLLQYEGRIYVRPVGRGVVLEDEEHRMQLDDLPDGYYRAEIRVWREV